MFCRFDAPSEVCLFAAQAQEATAEAGRKKEQAQFAADIEKGKELKAKKNAASANSLEFDLAD